MRIISTLPAVIAALLGSTAVARSQAAPVTVHGIAYDSLRGAPLSGAFVALGAIGRSTTSDARGYFRFDSVVPGPYTLSMQHDALDSIGVSGRSMRMVVTDGRDTVRIAVPSFATLWRASCGTTPPRDSGIVFGTVRDTSRALGGVFVTVAWLELSVDKTNKGVNQRRWRNEVRSDANGGYVACGVPVDVGLRVWATTDSLSSGSVDLAPRQVRVQRRDLLLAAIGDKSVAHGTIVGTVTGQGNRPVANAAVSVDAVPQVRTSTEGRFVLRDVPAGTREVEVRSIGLQPVTSVVDVRPGDTATVSVSLTNAVTLDPVRVNATTVQQKFLAGFEERRKAGLGRFLDSTTIPQQINLAPAFDGIAGVRVIRPRGASSQFLVRLPGLMGDLCVPTIWVDRVLSDDYDLWLLQPQFIAAIEVYPRAAGAPMEYLGTGRNKTVCGIVMVWTKRAFP